MSRDAPTQARPPWSRRQWLLGVGLAVTGLAAWWQIQTRPEDEGARPARERLPDYTVRNFAAVETDATGQPSRRLVAEELRHYAKEDISELEHPRMELYQTDGPPWLARSRQGTVLAGGDQVRLFGEVRLDREADRKTRATHLETERVDIWRQRGLAETDLPVRILSDGDSLSANGMKLWYQEPTRTSFHGRARIRLAPEPGPEPNQP
ncbi:LPS export ABC transporter periplasmic protein LptC [Thiocystis violacea]|uniref:LPS export ABC transporter periplasmic protein LptC n=1 Tax=Thiocystis violacea TaxID=13725 RepID=UPI0019042B7C|nr:LPS export ABC transporter periplasmic protein LptC [Thiocystis violacea]MBK1716070.1 LPS export ABC transporter periplasmic protein LptC [Thiocystis violacea]